MATIEGAVFNQLNTVYKLFNYVLPRAVNATVLQEHFKHVHQTAAGVTKNISPLLRFLYFIVSSIPVDHIVHIIQTSRIILTFCYPVKS